MALATRARQVVLVNGRGRVGGGKDLMIAVATGAICGEGRAVLRRQAMVAFEESLHAVGREIVFGVEALGGVASAAQVLGNLERRTGSQRLNPVLRVAISAGGCLSLPFSLAVNA